MSVVPRLLRGADHRHLRAVTDLAVAAVPEQRRQLGLERGGACRGVIYRIAERDVESELDIVWRREMLTGAYDPVWVNAIAGKERIRAVTFVMNRESTRYAGRLSDDQVALIEKTSSVARSITQLRRTVRRRLIEVLK